MNNEKELNERVNSPKLLISNNLKDVRSALGVSAYALERHLDFIHPYIKKVETGQVILSIDRLAALCVALDCAPSELIKLDFRLVNKAIRDLRKKGLTSIFKRAKMKA